MYKNKNTGIIQSDSVSYSYVFVANQCLTTLWQDGRIVLRTLISL